MTGLVRRALTFAAGLALVASLGSVAWAGVPDPANSTTDPAISGNDTGNAIGNGAGGVFGTDAVPGFEVKVKDISNLPLANVNVVLDFSATGTNTLLQSIQNSLTTANCTAKTLSKLTNASGDAVFAPRFGGFDNGNNVEVRANGVVLANRPARSTDMDKTGGTDLPDLNLFRVRFFDPAYNPEIDYNQDSNTNELPDLNIFRVEFFAVNVTNYCAP